MTNDIFAVLFALCLMLLGLIQLLFPQAAIRLRNRFGDARRFDGTQWIYSSRYGSLFVRLCGLVFIFMGGLILGY